MSLDDVMAFATSVVTTREKSSQDWARTQANLGGALWDLGSQLKGEERLSAQQESVELLREVVSHQPTIYHVTG